MTALMTDKALIVAAVTVAALIVAALVQRRAPAAPATSGPDHVPSRLDRSDFGSPAAPWMVVLFTSSTCDTCGDVRSKVEPLRSAHVAVVDLTFQDDLVLHRKYGVDAVPMCLLVDAAGVVRRSFIGAVSSTHLWGALAELRDPGSVPEGCGAAGDQWASGGDEGVAPSGT